MKRVCSYLDINILLNDSSVVISTDYLRVLINVIVAVVVVIVIVIFVVRITVI